MVSPMASETMAPETKKRQRGAEIDQRQVPIGGIVMLRQQDDQRAHHQQAVQHAQPGPGWSTAAPFPTATTYEKNAAGPEAGTARFEIARQCKW